MPDVFDPIRPPNTVAASARYLGISERSLRRAVVADGELEHLAIRIGHRVVIRTEALLRLVAGDL